MLAYSGCCRGRRVVMLCIILVLSGCNSNPFARASLQMSVNILVSCRSEFANNSTSSANRKLVRVSSLSMPKCIPAPRRAHSNFSFLNIDSDKQLKSNELRGSPCLVPRCMLKSRLITSVLTVAVCPVYNCVNNFMYPLGMPCSANDSHKALCATVSNAFLKSSVAIQTGICHSRARSCIIVNVKRWSSVLKLCRNPA